MTTTTTTTIKHTEKALTNGGTLERLFTPVTAKILDFLSIYRNYDYSKQDIAKYSGVSPRHATNAIEKLENLNLITHTRNVGHANMYKYNTDNPTAKLLQKFSLSLAFDECQKLAEQQLAHKNDPKQIITEEANMLCLMLDCIHNTKKNCTTPHQLNGDICLTYKKTNK
jgi:hypothetical protein